MKNNPENNNWGILGHENIVQFLQSTIKNKKVSHAYLFNGQDELGKYLVAERFCQNLICELDSNQACGKCSACKQYENKLHPDAFWLQRQEDKKNISIEEIRVLQSRLSQKSFFNSYKVAIINDAHELSEGASNSLLKTLEEPTSKTVIILITSQKDNLPQTIISRCQVMNFMPVSKVKIYDYLEKETGREQAHILANLSNGRPGTVFKYLENDENLVNYQKQVQGLIKLMNVGIAHRFEFGSRIMSKKEGFIQKISALDKLINQYFLIVRDLVLIKAGQEEAVVNYFAQEELQKAAEGFSEDRLVQMYKELKQTREYLNSNINPSLALENLLINL